MQIGGINIVGTLDCIAVAEGVFSNVKAFDVEFAGIGFFNQAFQLSCLNGVHVFVAHFVHNHHLVVPIAEVGVLSIGNNFVHHVGCFLSRNNWQTSHAKSQHVAGDVRPRIVVEHAEIVV